MIDKATSLHLASVWAVLPLLCACASSGSAGAHTPRVVPQQPPTMSAVPVDGTPAYRARVIVVVNDAGPGDSWTDITVSNLAGPGRRICETLVENQLRVLTGAGLHPHVDRPCGEAPLVPVKVAAGEVLLVAERAISEVDLLLLMPQDPDGLEDVGRTTVTDFARFKSRGDCQQALARMAAIRQRDRAAADEAARGWLEGQVRQQEAEAKRACEEKDQVESRCAPLPGGKAEIEKACRASTMSKRCEKARQRGLERSACEIEQQRAVRSCETARAMLEAVRARLAAPQHAAPNLASTLECRGIKTPETRD